MTDALSNSAVERDALLAKAKRHAAKAEEFRRKSREHYLLSRDAILAAKALDSDLSNYKVAKAIGRSANWVDKLVRDDWVATDGGTPFAGRRDPMQGVRKAATEQADDFVDEVVLRHPHLAERIAQRHIAQNAQPEPISAKPDGRREPKATYVRTPVLRTFDIVKMGGHLVVVGDATDPLVKLKLLKHAGWPFRREFFYPDAADEEGIGDGEMDVVVVTDQPYGQSKLGIANDDKANWGVVYRLFQPRGGFVFCAFHPPLFRLAEDGIYEAGGDPKHYLALDKGGGRMWGGDRVQNRLDAIIYFERNGDAPWKAGRRAVSLLRPDRSHAAMQERQDIGGGHATPKYIDVLTKLIELATEPGDIVFDPFTGSGTTLIAAHRAGRRFFGVELKPKWAERAVRNWMAETGEDAIIHRLHMRRPLSLSRLIEGVGFPDVYADRR